MEADFPCLDTVIPARFSQVYVVDDGVSRQEVMDAVAQAMGADDIPKVFIDGAIPTTKTDVYAKMEYISKTERFSAYLKIKCQGSSSMSYSKKNFTIKMYSDEARETKLKKTFKDWGHASHKFTLKANYIDHSHARNIVCANLWDEVVSSRADYDTLPEELRNSPRNGAIDGFPIKVYINGTYQGIYTWNIGKDDWMWGMDEDNENHVLLCGERNTDGVYAENACNFRALWSGINEDNWSVEVGTNSEAVKNSLNALISCVKDTDDETFKATIGNYLDVQSAMDYWIHQYVICGLDGLAKNMLLATYDGVKWICGAYDMDSTFGLWWEGNRFVSAEYQCPEDYQEKYSLLWERMASLFSEEIKTRYTELRNSVYSYANMVTMFERFTDTIGNDLYAEDLEVYTGIPSGNTNNIKQIRNYIRDRLAYVDACMNPSESDLLYELPGVTEFDGSSFYIDTGIQLFDTEKDFTIFIDLDGVKPDPGTYGFLVATDTDITEDDDQRNLGLFYRAGDAYPSLAASGKNHTGFWEDVENGNWAHSWENLSRIALVFTDGVFSFGKYLRKSDPTNIRYIHPGDGIAYRASDANLTIGAKKSFWSGNMVDFWKGTVNTFRIYNRAFAEEEANAIVLGE